MRIYLYDQSVSVFRQSKTGIFSSSVITKYFNFDPVYRIYERRSAATAERVVWSAPLVVAVVVAAGVVVSGIGTQHATSVANEGGKSVQFPETELGQNSALAMRVLLVQISASAQQAKSFLLAAVLQFSLPAQVPSPAYCAAAAATRKAPNFIFLILTLKW